MTDIYQDGTYIDNNPSLHREDSEYKSRYIRTLLEGLRFDGSPIRVLDMRMMSEPHDRLAREGHTIQVMVGIYCRENHRPTQILCPKCQGLFNYAMQRMGKCPFLSAKPTCAKCPIHCYKPEMREQVRQVMRYAGPRMMIYHPFLALRHYADQIRWFGKA